MAVFHFRLEASLNLAEQILHDKECILAGETQKLLESRECCTRFEQRWMIALSGQKEGGSTHPEDLGKWQRYAVSCYEEFQDAQKSLQLQEERVDEARRIVIQAHQEMEKFRRLKEKQWQTYRLIEQKQEQRILDEAGQIIYFRGKSEGTK